MNPVSWLLLGWLLVIPAYTKAAPAAQPVMADILQAHQHYLVSRLQQDQFAAINSLLATLDNKEREFLLFQLLGDIHVAEQASPRLQDWVATLANQAPQWLVEQQVNGFLVQQPAYDFTARARQLLGEWQRLALEADYRQQLEHGSLHFKSIYYSGNPDIIMQQQALLQALDKLPPFTLRRVAHELAAQNIYLPDNRLLLFLLQHTGEPALYGMLWRRPADPDALRALSTINRFHHGTVASDLLLAASGNQGLKEAALRQLSTLSPLPSQAQTYLLAELSNRQYGALVAGLLMEMDEPQLLSALARRLGQRDMPPIAPSLQPDSGTPDGRPGL